MVFGYVRVSTHKQNAQSQRLQIQNFCKANNIKVDVWLEEKISGIKAVNTRALGKKVLFQAKKDDIILCTELSRLGRSLFMIFSILQYALEQGIKIWTIKEAYKLGNNIESKVLAFAFGLSAEIERDLIRQRTKQGVERAKKEGKIIGRPQGRKSSKYKLSEKDEYIKFQLIYGIQKAKLARELGVHPATLERHLKRIMFV